MAPFPGDWEKGPSPDLPSNKTLRPVSVPAKWAPAPFKTTRSLYVEMEDRGHFGTRLRRGGNRLGVRPGEEGRWVLRAARLYRPAGEERRVGGALCKPHRRHLRTARNYERGVLDPPAK